MPMAARSLNQIVATVMISSDAHFLTLVPAFARLTHRSWPTSINFDAKAKMKTMVYHSYFTTRDGSPLKGNKMHHEVKCRSLWGFGHPTPDLKSKLNKTDCGTFPADDNGKLMQEVLKKEYQVRKAYNSELWFRDVNEVLEGDTATNGSKLKLKIHYIVYDESKQPVCKSFENNASPVEVDLRRRHTLGPGFQEAIHGMRVGGIRRMILPEACGPMIRGGERYHYVVMDVELLAISA